MTSLNRSAATVTGARLAFKRGRSLACAIAACLSPAMSHATPAAAAMPGHYRLIGGPHVASELVLNPDGHFLYFLTGGSLDEQGHGQWEVEGANLRLTTTPPPVPAVFSAGAVGTSPDAPLILHVIGANGSGIAGVDLRVGFDSGDTVEGYTQDYGWSLPDAEKRRARWVEFALPIYRLASQRFPLDLARGNAFHFVLTPNDLGVVDFAGVPIAIEPGRLIMDRGNGPLIYEAEER